MLFLGEKCLVDKEDNYDWIACAGMLETIINNFQECNALLTKLKTESSPNPISFLVNTSEIVSSLMIKSEKYIEITEKVPNNLLKSSPDKENDNIIDHFIEHDPGKRK